MDLVTHLRTFVAVAEARSFTLGAAGLRTPQPVVSRRIGALERELGDRLFTRSARQVRVTEFGERLLPHAADLVARADRLLELAATQRDRTLRIGLPPDVDPKPLAAALGELDLTLDVVTADPRRRREGLEAGTLQLALLGSAPDAADIAVPLGAGCPPGAPARVFHLDELRRRRTDPGPLLRLYLGPEDDHPDVRRRVGELFAAAGLSPVLLELPESDAGALTMTHARAGVLLCPARFARAHGLAWRPLAAPKLYRCYAIRVRLPAPWADQAERIRVALAPYLLKAVGGVDPHTVLPARARSLAPHEDARA